MTLPPANMPPMIGRELISRIAPAEAPKPQSEPETEPEISGFRLLLSLIAGGLCLGLFAAFIILLAFGLGRVTAH